MYSKIKSFVESIDVSEVSLERKLVLDQLVQYVQSSKNNGVHVNLNFICTHNSRRSQFSQIWAKVMADNYHISINSFSSGVEVTACNERTIASLLQTGFLVSAFGEENPIYNVKWSDNDIGINLFSKLITDDSNPRSNFAAIMTCSHADENCPIVFGCDVRIPIRYEDPKAFDDTPKESEMYSLRSREIATEMKYVFSKIK